MTVFTHVLPIWFARSVPRKGRATTERSRKASVLGSTITLRKQERNFCLRRDAPVFPRKPPLKSPRMKMGCQSCNPGWVSVSILQLQLSGWYPLGCISWESLGSFVPTDLFDSLGRPPPPPPSGSRGFLKTSVSLHLKPNERRHQGHRGCHFRTLLSLSERHVPQMSMHCRFVPMATPLSMARQVRSADQCRTAGCCLRPKVWKSQPTSA